MVKNEQKTLIADVWKNWMCYTSIHQPELYSKYTGLDQKVYKDLFGAGALRSQSAFGARKTIWHRGSCQQHNPVNHPPDGKEYISNLDRALSSLWLLELWSFVVNVYWKVTKCLMATRVQMFFSSNALSFSWLPPLHALLAISPWTLQNTERLCDQIDYWIALPCVCCKKHLWSCTGKVLQQLNWQHI